MAKVARSEWRFFLFATAFWVMMSLTGWAFFVPWYLSVYYDVERFVTNNRQDGPPEITIEDGPFRPGDAEDGGSPIVKPDWLAQRPFRDYRTVYIYHDSALGAPACAPFDLPEPPGGYNNRGGRSYSDQSTHFSLDRWTGFGLSTRKPSCTLAPGLYVVETEYRVPVLGGLFHVTFNFTSNVFEVTADAAQSEN